MNWTVGPGWADFDNGNSTGTVRRATVPTGIGRGMVVRWVATVNEQEARAKFGSKRDAQKFVESRV